MSDKKTTPKNKRKNSHKTKEKHLPEKKYRASGLELVVWANRVQKGKEVIDYHVVELFRNYKGNDGEWKRTYYLRAEDLPAAGQLLCKAYDYLCIKTIDPQDYV